MGSGRRGRGLVHHVPAGIAVRPDAAGINEGLPATLERVENRIHGRRVHCRVVADRAIRSARGGANAGGIGEVTPDRLDARGPQAPGRNVTSGEAHDLVASGPQMLRDGGADVSRRAGEKYKHTVHSLMKTCRSLA
jgi:hypothetical protein